MGFLCASHDNNTDNNQMPRKAIVYSCLFYNENIKQVQSASTLQRAQFIYIDFSFESNRNFLNIATTITTSSLPPPPSTTTIITTTKTTTATVHEINL
jgi:hypothetical protein